MERTGINLKLSYRATYEQSHRSVNVKPSRRVPAACCAASKAWLSVECRPSGTRLLCCPSVQYSHRNAKEILGCLMTVQSEKSSCLDVTFSDSMWSVLVHLYPTGCMSRKKNHAVTCHVRSVQVCQKTVLDPPLNQPYVTWKQSRRHVFAAW